MGTLDPKKGTIATIGARRSIPRKNKEKIVTGANSIRLEKKERYVSVGDTLSPNPLRGPFEKVKKNVICKLHNLSGKPSPHHKERENHGDELDHKR
jgi:hypothetical protein